MSTTFRPIGLIALVLGVLAWISAARAAEDVDASAMNALHECQRISTSCATTTKDAKAVLVFPSVIKADLIVGGAGGKGVLIENGTVTGHYNIGAGSAGLQAGVENASQIYVFRTQEALDKLKNGQDWKAGATAGVTLVKADTNVQAVTGDVLAYVFDSKGLNAGVSLEVFDVWKSGQERPKAS